MNDKCNCAAPKSEHSFYCERHKVEKTLLLWKKCQQRGDFWDAWENGRGPGQNNNTDKSPGLLKRAVNFGKAAAKHIATGMKKCTEEQKAERYIKCSKNTCGFFRKKGGEDKGVCAHRKCGCYIRSQGQFLDKLSWAESKCPVGIWGPIKQKSPENPENGV